MRRFPALRSLGVGGALALAACVHPGLTTPHALAVDAETGAEGLYVAAATSLNALAAQGAISTAARDRDRDLLWADLQKVRAAYAAGQDLTTLITTLKADVTAVQKAP